MEGGGHTDLFHLNGGVERLVENNEDAQVDPWEVTNGAKGYNSVSRHIVYAGGVEKDGKTPKDTRTGCQKKALEKYVKDFHRKFPDVRIIGHNEPALPWEALSGKLHVSELFKNSKGHQQNRLYGTLANL